MPILTLLVTMESMAADNQAQSDWLRSKSKKKGR